MGICIYCGQKAGIFSKKHKECEQKHNSAVEQCKAVLKDYFLSRKDMPSVMAEIKLLSDHQFLKDEEIIDLSADALGEYQKSVSYPVTKEHLQKVDEFLRISELNPYHLNKKNNDLRNLCSHLLKGALSGYFTRNEPIESVEEMAEAVMMALPISKGDCDTAKLNVLDDAANIFLADSLIDDDEQRQIDTYIDRFQVPMEVVTDYNSKSNVVKIKQSNILRDVRNGKPATAMDVTLPIVLTAGEYIVWDYDCVTMAQEKIEKEWVGRSTGTSVRVAKGVYCRVGGSRGYQVESSYMENQGYGTLVMTNKNLIFFSREKSLKVPYKKIISFIQYSDGIEIQRDGANAKRLIFQGFDSWFLCNFLSYVNV